MYLETDNYIVRPWELKDAKSLAKHANNIKVAENLRDGFPYPYSYDDAINWIKMVLTGSPDIHSYAIVVDNEVVGSLGLVFKDDVYRLNAEIGYFLGEKYWNQGIMTSVIKNAVDYVFRNYEVIRIYAEIFEFNKSSARILEKNGFVHEATLRKNIIKNGKIYDSFVYSILKE